jgi:tight adherence protein B
VRRKGKRTLVPAIVLASLVAAAPAAAGVRISGVDTSGYPNLRVTVVSPAGNGAPTVRENGKPVAAVQVVNLGNAKSVVLAVDRSQSMRGAKIRAATAAARAFVDAKASSDRVEVIGFGSSALALTKFSSSTTDADAALADLTVDTSPGTAIWDAVVAASARLRREGEPGHVIVLVTDGRDVSSTATLETAVAAALRAHAAVYAIGIAGGRGFAPGDLRRLASQTGGRYLQATSSADLNRLYDQINRTLAHTWQIRYLTAARPGEQVQFAVSVPGGGTVRQTLPLNVGGLSGNGAALQPSVLPRSAWRSSLAPFALTVAVGFLVLLAVSFGNAARGGTWLNARLAPHLKQTQRTGRTKQQRPSQSLRKTVVGATENAFANVKQFRALQELLTRADLPLLAAELLYVALGCAIFVALVATVAGAPALVTLLLMAVAGGAPIGWVAMRARKRIKAFDNQLADLLITIAASLKAGHSFRHAIQSVVEEGAEPAAKEFRRVLTETRLGRPMDEALAEMADRIGSKNLSFVLNAVTIQRQIGGSLAGLFDMVAETVRQRQQFVRKIRGLTAMGRMSAYVLLGLPFAMSIMISLISPSYMSPLWHTTAGHEMVGVGFVMLGFGSLILRKIVSFKG